MPVEPRPDARPAPAAEFVVYRLAGPGAGAYTFGRWPGLPPAGTIVAPAGARLLVPPRVAPALLWVPASRRAVRLDAREAVDAARRGELGLSWRPAAGRPEDWNSAAPGADTRTRRGEGRGP